MADGKFLDEIVEQIKNKPAEQWRKYWFAEPFKDKKGNFCDHSLVGYFTEIFLPSRNYRDGGKATIFVEANYMTLHSGERLNTFYLYKIYTAEDCTHHYGDKAKSLFYLVKEKVDKTS